MSISDLIKLESITPLQEQVKDLGMCPKCHSKTLAEKFNNGEWRADQCSTCLTVYMGQARKLTG